jgi:hypothetical protein
MTVCTYHYKPKYIFLIGLYFRGIYRQVQLRKSFFSSAISKSGFWVFCETLTGNFSLCFKFKNSVSNWILELIFWDVPQNLGATFFLFKILQNTPEGSTTVTAVISIKHVKSFVNKVENQCVCVWNLILIDNWLYVFYAYNGSN